MNSKKNGDLRCSKKSAFKTVKGFTLIELIIVIAIIGILAGISSMLITGFIRDANTETVNNKAQQVYNAAQNMLIHCEIYDDTSFIDPKYVGGDTKIDPENIYISFRMDNGEVTSATVSDGTNTTAYSDANNAGEQNISSYKKLKKHMCDSLASDFTGSSYISIDLKNYVVDAVVYSEFAEGLAKAIDSGSGFANTYKKVGSTSKLNIYGCDDIYEQKEDYHEVGYYVGFYPLMSHYKTEFVIQSDRDPY